MEVQILPGEPKILKKAELMVVLNPEQTKIINSLMNIKKHNSNKKNIKLKFQEQIFNPDEIKSLEENKLIRKNILEEYQLTSNGEKEYRGKLF